MTVEHFWYHFWTLIFFDLFWVKIDFFRQIDKKKYKNLVYPIIVPKTSKSKNGVKMALRLLFKELWAILGFSKNRGFTSIILTHKIYFDPQMSSNPQLKSDFGNFLVDFCNFFVNLTKKIDLIPKKFKKINVQKWCQNRSTAIIKRVMSNFRFFKNLKLDLLV